MTDIVEESVKPRRCSKYQQPVKGHNGPTGTKCMNQTDDIDDVELDHEHAQASARSGDEHPGTSATMPKEQFDILVNIMTSINLNMEVIHKSNRDILKALIPTENSQSAMATPRVGVASTSPNSNYTDNIVTLPISGSPSEKTVKHALSGEFVNLSDFLPNLTEPVANLETSVSTKVLCNFALNVPHDR